MNARVRARLQAADIVIVCLLFFFIVLKPWISNLGMRRNFQICQTNVQKMAKAIAVYADDWDNAYPLADRWIENIAGHMTATSGSGFDVLYYFHCPSDHSGSKTSYAYNDLMSGYVPNLRPKPGNT